MTNGLIYTCKHVRVCVYTSVHMYYYTHNDTPKIMFILLCRPTMSEMVACGIVIDVEPSCQ